MHLRHILAQKSSNISISKINEKFRDYQPDGQKRGQAGPSQNLKQSLLRDWKYKNGSVFYFGVVISLRQCGERAQRVKQLHPCNCLETDTNNNTLAMSINPTLQENSQCK